MVLCSHLGLEEYRERVKIYATDVDEEALAEARQARYDERDVRDAPPADLDAYFERVGPRFAFSKELRRSMIFGLDLLLCRNTLVYVNSEARSRILKRFGFALNDDGLLVLGRAEMLLSHGNLFTPVDLRRRVFRPAPATHRRNVTRAGNAVADSSSHPAGALGALAFDAVPAAQVVVDGHGRLAMFNERAAMLFDLTKWDVGVPFQDLDLSYRPVDLRTSIDQAGVERRPLRLEEIEWGRTGVDKVFLDVRVMPLLDADAAVLG